MLIEHRKKKQCCGSALVSMRIRFQVFISMRHQIQGAKPMLIHADPDPQHWNKDSKCAKHKVSHDDVIFVMNKRRAGQRAAMAHLWRAWSFTPNQAGPWERPCIKLCGSYLACWVISTQPGRAEGETRHTSSLPCGHRRQAIFFAEKHTLQFFIGFLMSKKIFG